MEPSILHPLPVVASEGDGVISLLPKATGRCEPRAQHPTP